MNTEERLDYLEGKLAALEKETEDDVAQFGGLVAALQDHLVVLNRASSRRAASRIERMS